MVDKAQGGLKITELEEKNLRNLLSTCFVMIINSANNFSKSWNLESEHLAFAGYESKDVCLVSSAWSGKVFLCTGHFSRQSDCAGYVHC